MLPQEALFWLVDPGSGSGIHLAVASQPEKVDAPVSSSLTFWHCLWGEQGQHAARCGPQPLEAAGARHPVHLLMGNPDPEPRPATRPLRASQSATAAQAVRGERWPGAAGRRSASTSRPCRRHWERPFQGTGSEGSVDRITRAPCALPLGLLETRAAGCQHTLAA